MAVMIAGVFPSRDQAEAALRELRDRGFRPEEIGLATLAIPAQARTATAPQTPLAEPFGWIPNHRTVSMSGQKNVLVAGQIADCHQRQVTNQDTVAGLLMCLGVEPEHARWYDQQVCQGYTLITVLTDHRGHEVETIMRQFGSIEVPGRERRPSTTPEAPLIQNVGKQEVVNAELQSVEPGWAICGSDGQQIGKVDEIGPNYLMTKKGIFFTHDVYIPFSAIWEVLPNQVKLNIPANRIRQEHWNYPPPVQSSEASNVSAAGTTQASTLPTASTSQKTTPIGLNKVQQGFDVYTLDDQRIGTVQEASPECIHVLQCSNFFIPPEHVERVENDRIVLNVSKDQMNQVDWSTCHPAHRVAYQPGGPGDSGLPPQEHTDGISIPIETVNNDQSRQA